MGGEARETRFDRLLVADVGEDAAEDADAAALACRNQQARLRHQHEQADGLERDRFAARVGPRDYDPAQAGRDTHVDRHDLAPAGDEQRMARFDKFEAARLVIDDRWFYAAQALSENRAR